ncbi:Metallopeptidase, catalytic domain protein [Akanthomyces lecanii RCEF 1005]|uniref:Metallopeptidase, catalytic domain protein n=1 Tax=Akanthomyces lecanii RCEF 1005 TaxID=1081108 RepID=A0A168JJG8_CORDF|nr:Metallopeptidase, catalytic domain protein [Akanthomyces lecanii RCEF 1005]
MKVQSLLQAVLSHAALVLAGSRAWEASIAVNRANASHALFSRDSTLSNSYGNGSVSSGHTGYIGKRWIGNPNSPSHDFPYKLWENGNIDVCFEDKSHTHKGTSKTTEAILKDDLTAARELWRNVGLDNKDNHFAFEFRDRAWCDSHRRNDYLEIAYAGEGVRKMATSPGQVIKTSDTPTDGEAGSTSILSDLTTMGMKNVVSNYAHEMGHAWGLFHEHQNPMFWSSDYSSFERDKAFFGKDNWNCKNLLDYEAAVARVDANDKLQDYEKPKHKEWLCTKRSIALTYDFSGHDYLPIEHAKWEQGRKEPDYDSIMIYPSDCGAKPGTKILLQKPSGKDIDPVYKPTKNDVKGLKTLYSMPTSKTKKFLGAIGSAVKDTFDKDRKKDSDSTCK